MKITRSQLRSLIKEAINEHRIKPSVANIPPEHLDKIHSLIDGGRLAQAQSFIDAFGGDPDYVDDYIAYGEVGDLEKLGNKASDVIATIPKDSYGFSKLKDMEPVYDIDQQAYDLVKSKILKDEQVDPEYFDREMVHNRRYYGNRNRDPSVDRSGYFEDDFIR